jgi:hypothetical protein
MTWVHCSDPVSKFLVVVPKKTLQPCNWESAVAVLFESATRARPGQQKWMTRALKITSYVWMTKLPPQQVATIAASHPGP